MRAALAFIRKELAGIYSPEEINSLIFLIFEHLKGYSRTRFILAAEETLKKEELDELNAIVQRLRNHEPVQYVLGRTEFYGLPFYTPAGVLIPRPETEELVQWIIQDKQQAEPVILDIGTGSGCIAVSLKKNLHHSRVMACDVSSVCLETIVKNAHLNQTEITAVEFDILSKKPEQVFPEFDVIVSNPPYIREREKTMMQKNVLEYEPSLALFVPDHDPLLFYRQIAAFAFSHLKSKGYLYVEINEAFGRECVEMFDQTGFGEIVLRKDIHGKDRMVRAVNP